MQKLLEGIIFLCLILLSIVMYLTTINITSSSGSLFTITIFHFFAIFISVITNPFVWVILIILGLSILGLTKLEK